MNNKVSNESPIGVALLGHKMGETVSVEAPDGAYELKILEIKL
jgi:transcription elongation factor GreA